LGEFAERFGGPEKLFREFFFTAVSPLGFTKDGRNYNFYDDPSLFSATQPFILQSLRDQVSLGVSRNVALVLGSGNLVSSRLWSPWIILDSSSSIGEQDSMNTFENMKRHFFSPLNDHGLDVEDLALRPSLG
jgi:hypothetical protein